MYKLNGVESHFFGHFSFFFFLKLTTDFIFGCKRRRGDDKVLRANIEISRSKPFREFTFPGEHRFRKFKLRIEINKTLGIYMHRVYYSYKAGYTLIISRI